MIRKALAFRIFYIRFTAVGILYTFNAMQPDDHLGIFDSGIGGLTVAAAIRKLMPAEKLIYFGDTAHLPYGDKSPESIREWAVGIADFLLEQDCKMLVIACNTISAVAYQRVKKHVGKRALVVNVIDPVAKHISKQTGVRQLGVIGTKATIKSDVYSKKIELLCPGIQVNSLATPLLAPMIEEGFFNNSISRTIINDYLSRPKLRKIDSLVLACTHYPLIRPEIDAFYKGRVHIFDTAGIVAEEVKHLLIKNHLLRKGKSGKTHFYVSDYTHSFEKSTQLFFPGKIRLEHKNLWKG